MNSGQLLLRGSVWPAIACGLAAILWNDRPRWTRRLWGAGLVFYVVHVASAFEFVHGWSHRQALEFTRRETVELTGWNSGFGLYANYAFTLAWIGYVAVAPRRRSVKAAPPPPKASRDDASRPLHCDVGVAATRFAGAKPTGPTNTPARLIFLWQVLFLFMAVNGAIIFARPTARWIGIGMFAVFVVAWLWRHRTRLTSRRDSRPSP